MTWLTAAACLLSAICGALAVVWAQWLARLERGEVLRRHQAIAAYARPGRGSGQAQPRRFVEPQKQPRPPSPPPPAPAPQISLQAPQRATQPLCIPSRPATWCDDCLAYMTARTQAEH